MNPTIIPLLATGRDLHKTTIELLWPRLTAALQQQPADVPVYEETRSIIGAVRRLYDVGSLVPATYCLFSLAPQQYTARLVAAVATTSLEAAEPTENLWEQQA